ncbi:four-carbon acid sugar kinase family protein [Eubacterium sp. 1001713B170207_170306_E7]|uniref:four-carbon acid sugar kinase family protein n=1 Tax=Eubacterium sp. 1001713B170207_170306_E7 TaxID=2787097 RepID=UPI00189AE006|nr:four-carbon acid sugar kinase family protein [Eubacterium sp. 1001713B170207_170306_E7]
MTERLDASILTTFKPIPEEEVTAQLSEALKGFDRKIVVLDDDPTGVQTVHDISVYTDWSVDSMRKGFDEENSMFFILTNSRGLTVEETTKAHREMAENILQVAKETGKPFVVISRSDSTLRGHYPLEPEILKDVIEAGSDQKIDGEIIYPFFKEGGRFTIGNVHYVQEGDVLVPAGETEFAKDKSFGYKASHLGEWCEEKSGGRYKAEDVTFIALEDLRNLEIDKITDQLMQVKDFNKIVVNSIDYADVKVFAIALVKAMNQGKNFIFRSAAAITKVLGGVPDKPILSHDELILTENENGGIIVVGSHVNKTTAQLEELKNSSRPIEFIEFNQHRVLEENGLEQEVERVVAIVDADIKAGKTVAVYTRRDRFDLDTDDKDEQLKVSVKISDAVTSIITNLSVRPNFIVAKGGITSSDIGTKALRVQKANVMGQIKPGIPVWMTGEESKFPGLPYVIFPGNVGTNTTLREAVETLMGV